MKNRNYILITGIILVLLASCVRELPLEVSSNGTPLPEGQYPLEIARITLGVEGGGAHPWGSSSARVTENMDGTGSVFDAGDKFAVQIYGEEGIYIVQDDGSTKAETPLYWSDSGEHTVSAWYPATDGTIDLGNQSQSLAYLLSGSGTGDYQTSVTLTFAHQLKKCEYTENGNAITCWEANVVPGYEIKKLRANGTEERNLSAAITPEAGSYYNITLDKDKGYTDDGQGNYTVTSAEGLKNLAELVNNGATDINITLTADIDLSGIDWTPIGIDYNHQYTGTFDGNGKTITGLTVTTSDQYAGLFGYLGSGGTVKNVVLEGVQITSDNGLGYVGGVAGDSWGTIENCSVSGSVSGSDVGGVVGSQWGGSITGCNSSATVKGMVRAGGVAGATNSGASLTGCYATGNVTIENNTTNAAYAGGVVGSNGGSSTLTGCYATGSVTGSGSGTVYVGGVTGTNDFGTLTACYHANGTISCPGGTTGGVAGRNFKDSMLGGGIITACFWGSNGQTQSIGEDQVGTGGTTMVTDGDWQNAVTQMNAALQNAGSEWQYEFGTDYLPVLKKS